MAWYLVNAIPVGAPDNSLPPGIGGGPIYPPYPDQGLPPGIGGGPVYPRPPGFWGGGNRPDQGLPGQGSGGGRPDQGLPPGIWPGPRPPRPDQGLPGGGNYPDQGLPGGGNYPDQGLPGGGQGPAVLPAVAEEAIPSHPVKPDPNKPGAWVLVGFGAGQVAWAWIQEQSGNKPDNTLPGGGSGGERPDQGLPGGGEYPDQGLPPTDGGDNSTPPPRPQPQPPEVDPTRTARRV